MKMTAEQMAEVIEAFQQGREIEYLNDDNMWKKLRKPCVLRALLNDMLGGWIFRIAQEPEYRPYKTIEEAMILMGTVIKHKKQNTAQMITSIEIYNNDLLINTKHADVILTDYEYYGEDMKHVPLGIKE